MTKEEMIEKWYPNDPLKKGLFREDLNSVIAHAIAEHEAMKQAECPQHFIVNGICQNCGYQREEDKP